ncbi:hypothetical protein IIQ_00013 [Bacillus cereus VD118]|uniref:Uncharacterized protein n=1 Tax=Bacillus cereus VD118 TaxID=1053231 RepID=R8QM66_BACCE|nr:hypothetical protein IIQ_00013 [Bacillus cereus VD118]CAH2464480.1 hypothetical protein ACOSJ1_EBGNOMHC_05014 [Bacillus mycoides KBAB4]
MANKSSNELLIQSAENAIDQIKGSSVKIN